MNTSVLRAWRGGTRACSAGTSAWLVALLALPSCDAPLVPPLPAENVYDYRLALDPPETLRWPVGSTIRVHVVEGGGDDVALRAAAAAGAEAWNSPALLDEYRLEPASRAEDADVLVAWSAATLPVEIAECRPQNGRAQTTFCLDGQRLFTYPLTTGPASAVKMLITIGSVLSNASPAELQAVLAHELGHVLGIARHSDVAADLMYTDPARSKPSQRDIATVRALYRSPADVLP